VEKSRKAYDGGDTAAEVARETAREKAEEAERKGRRHWQKREKATLQEGKSRLKKAIDAGVEAIQEEQKKTV